MRVQTTLVPGYAWVPPDYVYQPKQVDRPSAQDLKTMREEQIERMVEALTRGPCTITLLQEISGMGKTTVQKWVYGNNRVTSCEVPDELGGGKAKHYRILPPAKAGQVAGPRRVMWNT